MQLRYISIPHLIAEAGGDPWAINQTLQSGRPGQIADLAQAFHTAGLCTTASNNAFEEARRRFESAWNHENGDNPIIDSAEVQRAVQLLGAQSLQLPKIGVDLEYIAGALAEAQQTASGQIASLERGLQQLDDEIGQALSHSADTNVTGYERAVLNAVVSTLERDGIGDAKSTLGQVHSARDRYSDYLQKALMILRTDGYDSAGIGTFDAAGTPTKAEPEADRRRNQIEAFVRVFGRPPNSAADWETAEALDPHSYDPKNGGVPPNIVVGRIKPMPGQGVVRTNMFIPSDTVADPAFDPLLTIRDNLGDNRGFSPTAGPEESRVSIYVDYENGIIVARQNPSVEADSGRIRAGRPSVSAVQKSDGSVLLRYNTADPFSPGGEALAKSAEVSVNGTIAIEPTQGGPRVGGTVTNFPAIEIYSDRPGANAAPLLQSWPQFVDGRWGPDVGLLWHRPIGDASIEGGFNDLRPAFAIPDWLRPLVPIEPPIVATPPDSYPLGPVDHPPQIGIHDPIRPPPLRR
jgi:hypothetical protein